MADFVAYSPKTWVSREFIKKDAMNNIEQGIANNSQEIVAIENQMKNSTLTAEEIQTAWEGDD